MFENLQDGLKSAFKSISGKGKLTESNMRDGLKIVEESLLEADVSFAVVERFMERVSEKALGEKVLLSLRPSEQLISIVHEELIGILGTDDQPLELKKEGPTVFMLCGLQGSGKTTTCGKLTMLLQQSKINPMLVAADLQRPAAIEQLHVIGRDLGVPVYSEEGAQDPIKVCQNAVKKAKAEGNQVVILDTAGRLAIDEELMNQLKQIDRKVGPDQVFLVVDGMTGQDAVNSADAFNKSLELNGVIMTKLDGDARGGALLSVRDVTGVPIKFIGTGEHMDALEPFRAEGMAGRILGQGDMLELARQAQSLVDENEAEKLRESLEKGEFTLDDFRTHMAKIAKPGLMQKMMGLMPGMGDLSAMMNDVDAAGETRQLMGIIDSMTAEERRNPKVLDNSRRSRVAQGSGVTAQKVNEVVKQYEMMKPMITGLAGKNPRDAMAMMNELKKTALDPNARMAKPKKGTGQRMSAAQKKAFKKQRDRELRKKRRDKRQGKTGGDGDGGAT